MTRWVLGSLLLFGAAASFATSCTSGPDAPKGTGGASGSGGSLPDAQADATPDSPDSLDAAPDYYGTDWDAGLWSDPNIWRPLGPEGAYCGLYVAQVTPDPFPHLRWQSCGAGCEVADLSGFPTDTAFRPQSTVGTVEGETLIRMSFGETQLIQRVRDGRTLAALQIRNSDLTQHGSCSQHPWSGGSPSWFIVKGPIPSGYDPAPLLTARVPLDPGGALVWSGWFLPPHWYSNQHVGWSTGYAFLYGSDVFLGAPGVSSMTQIGSGAFEYLAGINDRVFWPRYWSATSVGLQGWSEARGAEWFYQPAGGRSVFGVSASPDYLVWGESTGDSFAHFVEPRLCWSRMPGTPADLVRVEGPILANADHALLMPRTWGDYAAVVTEGQVTDGGTVSSGLDIVQLSTGKLWSIPVRSLMAEQLAVGPDYVVAARPPKGPPYLPNEIVHWYRFKLTELDALVETAKSW